MNQVSFLKSWFSLHVSQTYSSGCNFTNVCLPTVIHRRHSNRDQFRVKCLTHWTANPLVLIKRHGLAWALCEGKFYVAASVSGMSYTLAWPTLPDKHLPHLAIAPSGRLPAGTTKALGFLLFSFLCFTSLWLFYVWLQMHYLLSTARLVSFFCFSIWAGPSHKYGSVRSLKLCRMM